MRKNCSFRFFGKIFSNEEGSEELMSVSRMVYLTVCRLRPSIRLSIHLSVHPSIRPSVCPSKQRGCGRAYVGQPDGISDRLSTPSVHTFIHSSVRPSIYPSVRLSIQAKRVRKSLCRSGSWSIRPFICLFVRPSVRLSVRLFVCLLLLRSMTVPPLSNLDHTRPCSTLAVKSSCVSDKTKLSLGQRKKYGDEVDMRRSAGN